MTLTTETSTAAARQAAGPLSGIRIVDLSAVLTGPFATHILADHGAEVIKVEAPGGDITRHIGEAPAPGMSSMFQHLNRNKRGIVLDLKQPRGREVLFKLIRTADALVFNMRPEAMARLGLSYAEVRAENPGIVYCGIVGFGEAGPYAGKPAYDDVIQGLAGIPDLVARANGGEPRFIPMAAADRIVGLYAANALNMALLHRARTGQGTAVEVPMFEAMAHFVMVEHMFYRSFDPPLGAAANPRPLDKNCKPHRTRDGYLCLLPYTAEHWHAMFDILERPDLHDDPRFAQTSGRINEVEDLYALLDARLPERDTAEWVALLTEADIPAMPMNRVEDVLEDPHLKAVDFFQRTADAEGGAFIHMAVPYGWSNWPRTPPQPAPRHAQHSVEVLREIGLDPDEIADLLAAGVVRDGARTERA
jgi:crotonobetainyl-CoA:carnitine CoA-transferase CaiB-like acyl-CoA transferase